MLGNSETAETLRKKFVFHIIPMMNPDGCINGFSRSDILGCDLNVQYNDPSLRRHPSVFYLRELIQHVQEKYSIISCIDLHGQAQKDGAFLYGVIPNKTEIELHAEKIKHIRSLNEAYSSALEVRRNWQQHQQQEHAKRNHLDPRVFFLQVARRSDILVLRNCSLSVGARKTGTLRAVAAKQFFVPISISVQISCFRRRPVAGKSITTQFISTDHAK